MISYSKDLKPQEIALPANSYAFKFMGSTWVVYHNPQRKNIFRNHPSPIRKIHITYPNPKHPVTLQAQFIPSPYSEDIRLNKVERIDVYFE